MGMTLSENLWRKLKGFRNELLNLKQSKKVGTNCKYYIYKVTGADTHYAWQITYKAGDQPIISEVYSYYHTSLTVPVNNKQYIISFSQASAELTVLSTREIQSVVGL
jgi:hypothetical protein